MILEIAQYARAPHQRKKTIGLISFENFENFENSIEQTDPEEDLRT